MNTETQAKFMYLFERVGEPLYFSPRGPRQSSTMYNMPAQTIPCKEIQDASMQTQGAFSGTTSMTTVRIAAPVTTPNLSNMAVLCPRSALYNYFNPQHRQATSQLRKMFLDQQSLDQLLSTMSVCRDSPMVNCKLWINAAVGAMLTHQQTRNFQVPAAWEIMPDAFFSSFTLRQAFRQSEIPENDRGLITLGQTARPNNPEGRLSYFREDVGVNSHHWHWHLIYRLDDPQSPGRRKGELFYYMHHAIISRYDAERLGFGMPRVRPFNIDDNPRVKEGYFGKLFDTNSGQNWGTRQGDTPLQNLNRPDLPPSFRNVTLEQLRKMRDRANEAIDTGLVLTANNERIPLNIDILGDIVEASSLTPHPQYYGGDGIHNVGHVLISYCHDPEYKHNENGGPMSDTTTAMRDTIFYRWHKYIDDIFHKYKETQQPYQDVGGDFPLAWQNIEVTNVQVQTTAQGVPKNLLRTFFRQSHVDLSRGLDFTRTDERRLGSIWLRFTHLAHDDFTYTITVRNSNANPVRGTVRIYLAPRLNEHGEQIPMTQQRKLFFELDKFTQELRRGETTITRRSSDSSLTIPWEQTFRDIERAREPTAQESVCGCGWPQHMLLPRGNEVGQVFDLVVFVTNTQEDTVQGTTLPTNDATSAAQRCREAQSFCGRFGQPYPDKKPMGYPFDRNPFLVQNQENPNGPQIPVPNLEQYVGRIKNMQTIQVRIAHNPNRNEIRSDLGPTAPMREINGDSTVPSRAPMCPDQGEMPGRGGRGGATSSLTMAPSNSISVTRPKPTQNPQRPNSGSPPSSPTGSKPHHHSKPQSPWGGGGSQWGSGKQWGGNQWGGNQVGGSQSQWGGASPGSSPPNSRWTLQPRPGNNTQWGWGG